MKKSAIIGKKQILTFTMVLALGAAVWLNVKFSTNGTDFAETSSIADADLGNAKYVANTAVVESENNYFTDSRKEREKAREEELDIIKDTLNSKKSTADEKQKAIELTSKITDRIEMENSIETLIKAKGFEEVIAVLSDDACSVVIKKDSELKKNESMQIIDIVSSTSKINLENIKIVTLK